jgi:pyruvate/2-oxoglutarate dehydrogenase complex dihydrolipoamide dehydrogenase (E3) component
VKALVEADSDRILGFTAFGVGAGEILAAVQIARIAGLPCTALREHSAETVSLRSEGAIEPQLIEQDDDC